MRSILLLAVLLLVPTASAAFEDDLDFTQTYYARLAVGDIPSTSDEEPAGQVNLIEYLRFDHPTFEDQSTIDLGFGFDTALCTCGGFQLQDNIAIVGNNVANGTYTMAVVRSFVPGNTFDVPLGMYGAGVANDAQINLYLNGLDVTSNARGTEFPGAEGPWTIYSYTGTSGNPLPDSVFFSAHPAVTSPTPAPVAEEGFGILELVVGIVIGALVWFMLVKQGLVQARTRKQVIQASAHQTAAASESKAMLEARKRVLMAGLKDLEKAKMAKEMDDEVYDKLKAELKREAVTAMRAIESAE